MSRPYSIPALLEMLREHCGVSGCGHCSIEKQAADEIDRLQAIVNELCSESPLLAERIKKQAAEKARAGK